MNSKLQPIAHLKNAQIQGVKLWGYETYKYYGEYHHDVDNAGFEHF